MNSLKSLNKYFIKYAHLLILGIFFVAGSNYFRVFQPRVIGEAIDYVVMSLQVYRALPGGVVLQAYTSDLTYLLFLFGGIVILLAIIMGIFMYFMRQTIIVMSRYIEYDMRKEIYDHYQRLDLAFYKRNKTGDLMSRITEDVSKVRMYLGPAILYGINLVSLFIFVIYNMLQVNVKLTFYSLAPLPFLAISIYLVSRLIYKRSTLIQNQLASLNNTAQESFSGIRVIKSYVQEKFVGLFFAKQSEEYKRLALRLAKVNALFFPLMVLLIGVSTIITVYVGGVQVVQGYITAGNIAEFVIYVSMLTWPATAIGWVTSVIQQAAASQQRLNEFLEQTPTIINPLVCNNKRGASFLNSSLEFKNVSFTYPDTGIVALQNVSFKLKPGQRMAVVGRTGSGKTTIAELILRMYDIDHGEILLDSVPISQIDLNLLRQKIGYVPQDLFLFSDSVANNISYGLEEVDNQQIKLYAQYADVHNDITELTMGYDAMVGERGVTLSGGQKQRIAIARALIKEPDLLILDDSLSAVDANTEKNILDYFENEYNGKSWILITNRIFSLSNIDKILVLDEGKIVDSGRHEELVRRSGYYQELYNLQQLDQISQAT